MSAQSKPWRVLRKTDGTVLLTQLKWCASHWCKFKGLMLRRDILPEEGLLFAYDKEGTVETSIHMLFMRFAISVIWLDAQGVVVDKKLAKPWRPVYVPQKPAQYFIEASPALLERVMIGDRLTFEEQAKGITT